MKNNIDFNEKARLLRIDILRMFFNSGHGHLSSALSCVEILTAIYWKMIEKGNLNVNHVILSKGHAAAALYAAYAQLEIIKRKTLFEFYRKGDTDLGGLLSYKINGVDIPTGSLGQGLPFATGIAKAMQLDEKDEYTYVVLGDGECQEGSIWEAAMFASQHHLNHLIVFIDKNDLQGTEYVSNVINMESLEEKWKAFGWRVESVDGHQVHEITEKIDKLEQSLDNRPIVIIANTIKGKGIKQLEGKNGCHGQVPKDIDWEDVLKDLNMSMEEFKNYEE